ncbi:MAG: penicillin-binding transpeptidase domain-containing protein [Gemmatimonadota bacterium]
MTPSRCTQLWRPLLDSATSFNFSGGQRGGLLLALLTVAACGPAPDAERAADGAPNVVEADLSPFFEGLDPADVTFVVLDGETGDVTRHNPERARERFLPASTYKIPNSLIALETGIAADAGFMLEWDGVVPEDGFWIEPWSQNHTLRSAIRNSVVWYYQELARRVGEERMQEYIDRFEYGNQDIGGGVDRFWLEGDLRISADEQVDFLRRMYAGELGISDRSTGILKDILVLEETPGYRLSGKTGTAELSPTRDLAWLVGYVERGEQVSFFALNLEGEQAWERFGQPADRIALTRTLLRETGALSGTSPGDQ